MSQTPNPKTPKTPKGNNPKGFKQPNRTNVVTIVVFIIIGIFFMFMMARTMTSATGVTQTDELQTSEFMQAVEQGRVSTAVYDTGSYTITGSYYPASTAGGASADAFNEAFDALNSELGTMNNGSARLNIVETQQLAVANLGFLGAAHGGKSRDPIQRAPCFSLGLNSCLDFAHSDYCRLAFVLLLPDEQGKQFSDVLW